MLRLFPVLIGVLAMAGAASAQAPASLTVHASLKTGRSIEVRDPEIIDGRLCGWMRADDEPASEVARPGCVTTSKIASASLRGVRHAVGESIDGSLCMAAMPLCFAKVAAIENRIVRKAVEKARTK